MIEKVLEGIIAAAKATAAQASGNDQDDWNHFADALSRVKDEYEENKPQVTPHQSNP